MLYNQYDELTDHTALLDNPGIKATLDKMQNQTVIDGVKSLLNEKYTFRSFERALQVLSTAQDERDLQIVEAALQTTITEIKEFNKQGSKYWDDKRTAWYLFTLQYIKLRLNGFELANGNKYKPRLVEKMKHLKDKCDKLGLDEEIITSQCTTTRYQQPDNEDLANFKFIDIERVDAFSKRLSKYAITRNEKDLYESSTYPQMPAPEQIKVILEKLVTHMEKKFGFPELDAQTYRQNFSAIAAEIYELFCTTDPVVVKGIIDAMTKLMEAKEKHAAKSPNNERGI